MTEAITSMWPAPSANAQRVAMDSLRNAGGRGSVVVLDPSTGGLLVMASTPTFDPNEGLTDALDNPASPLLNRATQGLYPPGSTFKVVTATAALNGGKWSASSTFDDKGVYVADSRPIYNSGKTKFGLHNLTDALTFSINTTFAKIGPCTNRKARRPVPGSSSINSVPVMSLGMRSGVNCTRENVRAKAWDTVCTSNVFASPGTPTSTTCPPARSAATRSSTR